MIEDRPYFSAQTSSSTMPYRFYGISAVPAYALSAANKFFIPLPAKGLPDRTTYTISIFPAQNRKAPTASCRTRSPCQPPLRRPQTLKTPWQAFHPSLPFFAPYFLTSLSHELDSCAQNFFRLLDFCLQHLLFCAHNATASPHIRFPLHFIEILFILKWFSLFFIFARFYAQHSKFKEITDLLFALFSF